jgi:DinB superfamily
MKDALEDFRLTIERGAERLLSLSEAQSAEPRAPDKWSAKEIVGHLVDSAANNHQRFVRAQFQDNLVFPGYAQEDWVAAQHYSQASWPLLVELWKLYNLHLLHLISHIPAHKLTRLHHEHSLDRIAWELVDASEPTTLEYLIRDYLGHLKHHLRQIFPEDAPPVISSRREE